MPLDPAAFGLPSAAETDTRAAMKWAKRHCTVADVLLSHRDERLAWDGACLSAPSGQAGRIEVVLLREPDNLVSVEITFTLPGQVNRSAILIPAHVLAAGD